MPNFLLHFNQLLGKKVPKLLDSYSSDKWNPYQQESFHDHHLNAHDGPKLLV